MGLRTTLIIASPIILSKRVLDRLCFKLAVRGLFSDEPELILKTHSLFDWVRTKICWIHDRVYNRIITEKEEEKKDTEKRSS